MARKNGKGTGSPVTGTPQFGGATATAPRPTDTKAKQMSMSPQPAPAGQKVTLTYEQIAQRAREIWIKKGCKPGQDEQNWLEAEAQLRAEAARR